METEGADQGTPLPAMHRTEVDGVPVFWADVDGPAVGALLFGVGRADEPAPLGGVSHLVEHLALAPLSSVEHSHNGFVAGWRTVFHASGTPTELAGFFDRVSAGISDLPLDRLGMERRILRQESASRDPGIVGRLLWWRFGNAGHGLLGTDEPALGWVGPDIVRDWARTRFTRERAAAWFSGRPPDGLTFHLPSGPPSPPTPIEAIDGVRFPAHMTWGMNGVSLSWLVERSAASAVAVQIAAQRARDILRFERGIVYDVLSDYEPLDGITAHAYMGADCAPEQVTGVRDALLSVLEALGREGPTEEEVRRQVRAFRDSQAVPQAMLGHLDHAVARHLQGQPERSVADLYEEYDALRPETIATAVARALPTLFLAAPGTPPSSAPGGGPWFTYPLWSTQALEGRTIRPAGWPLRNRDRKDRLIESPEGITLLSADGQAVTVRIDSCVAYVHLDDDRRELRGRDGFQVRVAAAEWQGGADLVRRLDAAVPASLVVCDEHGVGGMEDPPAT